MNVPSLPTDQGTTDNLLKIQTCHAPGQEAASISSLNQQPPQPASEAKYLLSLLLGFEDYISPYYPPFQYSASFNIIHALL